MNTKCDRLYEVMFVVDPDLPEEEMDSMVASLSTQISSQGGVVNKVEKIGRQRLAYVIRKGSRKFQEGFYILLHVGGTGREIAEIERRLRVLDPVIRFLTVRVDEDLKRAQKIKARRERRMAIRAARQAANNTGAEPEEEE
ncbi:MULTISPECIES: 30S ribosomal protein S6 [Chloracidobacterium]|nr:MULTISPECIES: 30S ribosomal protein S6 [Chloracidobacterium]QUV78130.1 30S ribosomal protein S6 [Chloracidobacterium thermophilum]QUV78148.1 30S ribosomal protein S6 [Chloracidobacterium thermophilum]QUV81190.1 30S ribosomal protein S6 [Chloracidobacterium sp. D]